MPKRWRVFIVGKPDVSRKLLADYLGNESGLEIEEWNLGGIARIGEVCQAAILLCDCRGLAGPGLVALLKNWQAAFGSDYRLLFYNVSPVVDLGGCLSAKSLWGVCYEDEGTEGLLRGLEAVIAGEIWLPRQLLSQCMSALRRSDDQAGGQEFPSLLSRREREVLGLVATGASNDEIADSLVISPHTVRSHIYKIFRKIKVDNRQQAAIWARRYLAD